MTGRCLALFLAFFLAFVALFGVSNAGAESTAPGGLRGLLRTRSADTAGHAVLEWGLFSAVHSLDDTNGGTHWFSITDLQFGYGLSPFLELGVALPVRAWTVTGGGSTAGVPRSQAGFGDLQAGAKLQLPLPWRTVRLGLLGDGSFGTGSASRGFTTGHSDLALGGAWTVDLSKLDRFPPTRVHLNVQYRWNRNEKEGAGLAPLEDVRQGGFWPPAYPPIGVNGMPHDNDQVAWRLGVEFSTRVTTLFTEMAFDDHPYLNVQHLRQEPWILTPGALVKFRNGINLKGAVDISLQSDDVPATMPRLPDWRFTLGVTWRAALTLGDRDHDGIPDKIDKCPDDPEDLDGFQDDDGCPDLDNDNDGVPDGRDLAPNLPEDRDGFQDEDGRPDFDNDGDGIRDADDKCPNAPEDFNGIQDTDGCPDATVAPAAPPAPAPTFTPALPKPVPASESPVLTPKPAPTPKP